MITDRPLSIRDRVPIGVEQEVPPRSQGMRHVAKSPSEFYALGGVLGIKGVGIFNERVGVEQFVRVFVRIGCATERGAGAGAR